MTMPGQDSPATKSIEYTTVNQFHEPAGSNTSRHSTSENKTGLSQLAKKYEHPTGIWHSVIAGTGKSGLTPLTPGPFATQKERRKHNRLELYQRGRCEGFSVRELVNLDAFAPLYNKSKECAHLDDNGAGGLSSTPIHPIFAQDRWRNELPGNLKRFYFQEKNGSWSEWAGRTPSVWKALAAPLRLASSYLNNSHNFKWFHGILNGVVTEVPKELHPKDWKKKSLLRVKNPVFYDDAHQAKFQSRLAGINIIFDIASGFVNPYTGMPAEATWLGMTRFENGGHGAVVVYLSYEILIPLMRSDISEAEGKLDVFVVANILLHELAHAIWTCSVKIFDRTPEDVEPYYEDEPLSELGFSLLQHVSGGWGKVLTHAHIPPLMHGLGFSAAAIFQSSFFNKSNVGYNPGRGYTPIIPPLPIGWNYDDRFPVPVAWFYTIQMAGFWRYARKYGGEATWMGPKVLGVRFWLDQTEDDPSLKGARFTNKITRLEQPDTIYDTASSQLEVVRGDMTEDEITARQFENQRILRLRRIREAVNEDIYWRRVEEQCEENMRKAKNEMDPDEDGDVDHSVEDTPFVVPLCPRYNEIRAFLLANRQQGQLCLDTLPPQCPYPANTILGQILEIGGPDINPDIWVDFLHNCNQKGEMFIYTQGWTRLAPGTVMWIEPKDPLVPFRPTPTPAPLNQLPKLPVTPKIAQDFVDIIDVPERKSIWLPLKNEESIPDVGFFQLHWLLCEACKDCCPGKQIVSVAQLRALIDYFDATCTLFCWGPNGSVRRLWDQWRGNVIDKNTKAPKLAKVTAKEVQKRPLWAFPSGPSQHGSGRAKRQRLS